MSPLQQRMLEDMQLRGPLNNHLVAQDHPTQCPAPGYSISFEQ